MTQKCQAKWQIYKRTREVTQKAAQTKNQLETDINANNKNNRNTHTKIEKKNGINEENKRTLTYNKWQQSLWKMTQSWFHTVAQPNDNDDKNKDKNIRIDNNQQ